MNDEPSAAHPGTFARLCPCCIFTCIAVNEHIATGGAECRYCPLCQVIGAVRDTSPEVKQHLATAATSLLHAATGLLQARADREGENRRPEPVEKIDLDDDIDSED